MKRFCPLKQVILEIGYIFSDNLQRGFEEKVNTIKKNLLLIVTHNKS